MISGTCRSMNNEIAGKMTSAVNGLDDTTAAVPNEAKATSCGMPVHNVMPHACTICKKRPEIARTLAHIQKANLLKHLQLSIIARF